MRAGYYVALLIAASASAARAARAVDPAPACTADLAEDAELEGASVSLLQTGSLMQHTIVTAEVDANAEVVEGEPLEEVFDERPTEEVSLLSVTPITVESSAVSSVVPVGTFKKKPTAAALALAQMVKEDAADASGESRASRGGRNAGSSEETVWRYTPYNKLMADIRAVPAVSGERTEFEIHPGAIFRVQEEVQGDNGITYLKLADGRGWLFDRLANGGVMCMRTETQNNIGTALLQTVSQIRSSFQATGGAKKSGRQVPHRHRGSRTSNLLVPVAIMLASIIAVLVVSRFARPQPVDNSAHVRPYMHMRPQPRLVPQDSPYKAADARSQSPRVVQSPLPGQAFNLVTGVYEASSPFGSQAPSRFVSRELPPVQAQVIQPQQQQQQAYQVVSPTRFSSGVSLGQMPSARQAEYLEVVSGRGRSPPRVRQAEYLEASMDLHSTRALVPQTFPRQCSAPPGVDQTGRPEMSFAGQWKSAGPPSRSMQLVPQTVPSLGSAQAALLQPPVPLGR